RGHAATALPAGEGERARRVPAPARGEHGRLERGVGEELLDAARMHHAEDALEGEAVLGTERQQHAVISGGGLELEVEALADPLAQGHAPRSVDPAAARRVDDELLGARLVEE